MLGRLLPTILFVSIGLSLIAQTTYPEVKRKSLSDILKLVENNHAVSFSYEDTRINPYKISYQKGDYGLNEFLELIFDQTALKYEFVDDKHIIVFDAAEGVDSESSLLCGYVLDGDNGEPLVSATVSTPDGSIGVVTDEDGYFEMSIDHSMDFIYCSYLGYEKLLFQVKTLSSDCDSYKLERQLNFLEEIEVVEYLDDGVTLSEDANVVNVSPEKMNMLPGNVEKDVLSTLQFLPGITSPSESLNALHVRGGTPDQNLILWDDIPMYHVSHMFGATGIFNPFIIDRIAVQRNGISSRYGGRVSSVIDISSKSQKPEKFSGGIGSNMMQVHGELNIPIKKFSSLFISTRVSLTDAWNSPTFISNANKVFQGTKIDTDLFQDIENEVSFQDFSLRYLFDNGKNKFDFSIITNFNDLTYITPFNEIANATDFLSLAHGGSKIAWERKWRDNFRTELMFTGTTFTKDYSLTYQRKREGEEIPVSFVTKNDLRESNMRIGAYWDFAENKSLNIGYQYTQDSIRFNLERRNFQNMSFDEELFLSELHAVYGDYNMTIPKILNLTVGLRYQYHTELKNEYFEPRINVTSAINDALTLKLSTSKNFQFVSQLVSFDTNELGFQNEIWIAANNDPVPVIESNQWSGGLLFAKNKWTIDFDAYVKELSGLTSFSDSFERSLNVPYSIGTARISGLDLLVKRRFTNFKSWVSYTFSKANYEFLQISSASFPATYDQRHVLQWVNMYNLDNWSFSLGMTAKSGLPYSIPIGLNNNNLEFEDFNTERLNNYLRVDASVVYNFKGKHVPNSYFSLSLQNIMNRENQLSRRFLTTQDATTANPEIETFDLIGLGFTPNISANISF